MQQLERLLKLEIRLPGPSHWIQCNPLFENVYCRRIGFSNVVEMTLPKNEPIDRFLTRLFAAEHCIWMTSNVFSQLVRHFALFPQNPVIELSCREKNHSSKSISLVRPLSDSDYLLIKQFKHKALLPYVYGPNDDGQYIGLGACGIRIQSIDAWIADTKEACGYGAPIWKTGPLRDSPHLWNTRTLRTSRFSRISKDSRDSRTPLKANREPRKYTSFRVIPNFSECTESPLVEQVLSLDIALVDEMNTRTHPLLANRLVDTESTFTLSKTHEDDTIEEFLLEKFQDAPITMTPLVLFHLFSYFLWAPQNTFPIHVDISHRIGAMPNEKILLIHPNNQNDTDELMSVENSSLCQYIYGPLGNGLYMGALDGRLHINTLDALVKHAHRVYDSNLVLNRTRQPVTYRLTSSAASSRKYAPSKNLYYSKKQPE